jgi:hypothetical protein
MELAKPQSREEGGGGAFELPQILLSIYCLMHFLLWIILDPLRDACRQFIFPSDGQLDGVTCRVWEFPPLHPGGMSACVCRVLSEGSWLFRAETLRRIIKVASFYLRSLFFVCWREISDGTILLYKVRLMDE